MTTEELTQVIASKAAGTKGMGSSLKFALGDDVIVIDGKGEENSISNLDVPTDCTLKISPDNLKALLEGKLNPMNAFMMGKIKLEGDMSVAMKLQSFLG